MMAKTIVVDGVEYRPVAAASGQRVVSLRDGWTWLGEYSEETDAGGRHWVVLRNVRNVQRYSGSGIGGVINDPSHDSVTLGAELQCEMRIPLHSVIWTAVVPCRSPEAARLRGCAPAHARDRDATGRSGR